MRRLISEIRGWGGYLLDLLGSSTHPHSYTKFRIIKSLKDKSKSRTFIEAGTYQGVTADRCSRIFDQVYTIELNQTLAQRAADFLKPKKNITVIQGDAVKILPQILSRNEIDQTLIYLDGHACDAITSNVAVPEPAIEALAALAPYKSKINAIVVDDFRNFGVEKNFPSKLDLLKNAERHFSSERFHLSVQRDQLVIVRK